MTQIGGPPVTGDSSRMQDCIMHGLILFPVCHFVSRFPQSLLCDWQIWILYKTRGNELCEEGCHVRVRCVPHKIHRLGYLLSYQRILVQEMGSDFFIHACWPCILCKARYIRTGVKNFQFLIPSFGPREHCLHAGYTKSHIWDYDWPRPVEY